MRFHIFLKCADEIVDRASNMAFWLFNVNRNRKIIFYLPVKKNDPSSGQAWPNPTEGWCTRWWPPRRRRSPSLRLSEAASSLAYCIHLAVKRVTKIDYNSETQQLWTEEGGHWYVKKAPPSPNPIILPGYSKKCQSPTSRVAAQR